MADVADDPVTRLMAVLRKHKPRPTSREQAAWNMLIEQTLMKALMANKKETFDV